MHSSAIDKTISTTLAASVPQSPASNGIAFTDVMDQINAGRADARDKRTQPPANNADSRSSRDDNRAARETTTRATSDNRDRAPASDAKSSRPENSDDTRTAHKDRKDKATTLDATATAPETVPAPAAEDAPLVETVQSDPAAPAVEDLANSTGAKTESEAKTDDTPVDATVIATPATPVVQTPAELALALAAAQQGGTTIPSNLNTGDETGMATGMTGDAGAKSSLMASTALSQTAPVSPVPTTATATKTSTPGNIGPADVADSFDALVNTRASLTGQSTSTGSESGGTTGNGSNNSNSQSGNTGQNPAATGNGAAQATPNNLVGMANVPAAAAATTATPQPAATLATAANSTLAGNSVTGTDSLGQVTLGNTNAGTSTGANNLAGQTAQTARNAPTQQVQQQVAVQIRNAASDGVDRISVQLRPESLGRVDIKMEISHDGRVQTVIQADNRETLDLLRQDVRGLQQALKDAGLNADSQSFTFEHRQGGSGQDQDTRNQTARSGNKLPDEGDILTGAELAEHVAIGYGVNPNGLVDIRI